MSKRVCPVCGEEMPLYRVSCDACGCREEINDEDLWKRIAGYRSRGRLFQNVTTLGGLVIVACIIAIIFGGPKMVLIPAAVVGLVICIMGTNASGKASTEVNTLIGETQGAFIETELRRVLGSSYTHNAPSTFFTFEAVRDAELVDKWVNWDAKNLVHTDYGKIGVESANVSLIEERQETGDEGGLETVRSEKWRGFWMICHHDHNFPEPVRIIADKEKEAGYILSDNAASCIQVSEMTAVLDRLAAATGGKASLCLIDDLAHFAVETDKTLFRMNLDTTRVNSISGLKELISREADFIGQIFHCLDGVTTIELK